MPLNKILWFLGGIFYNIGKNLDNKGNNQNVQNSIGI